MAPMRLMRWIRSALGPSQALRVHSAKRCRNGTWNVLAWQRSGMRKKMQKRYMDCSCVAKEWDVQKDAEMVHGRVLRGKGMGCSEIYRNGTWKGLAWQRSGMDVASEEYLSFCKQS